MRAICFVAFAACLAILSSSSLARAADVEITEASRRHFRAGVLLLEDPKVPRYEEAYREFKEAFAASPSYKILGNLGICAMKLERDDEAIAAFERYLAEMTDLDAAERAQIEKDLVTLRTGVVHVDVASNPPGAMIVDERIPVQGERVTNSYGPLTESMRLGIHQGHHRMTARLPGRADVEWEIDASGDLGAHVFTFLPPPSERVAGPTVLVPVVAPPTLVRPIPARVYVGIGVTAAALVGATITGISALSSHDDYARLNDGRHTAEANDARDTGRRLNLATDLLLGTAVVAASVTTVLYLLRPSVEAKSSSAWHVSPMYGSGGAAGVSVGGAFQ